MGGDFESIQAKASDAGVDMDLYWYRGIFRQAFRGLHHLHKNCIVHSDIKEANLMVKRPKYEKPEVVIIDLGLASSLKAVARVCGTPGYMPPETWKYGAWLPTGDVFSMGVTICQMLTRNIPNPARGIVGIFQRGKNFDEIARYTAEADAPIDDMEPSSVDLKEADNHIGILADRFVSSLLYLLLDRLCC